MSNMMQKRQISGVKTDEHSKENKIEVNAKKTKENNVKITTKWTDIS